MSDEAIPEYCACETLVLGCGNELFGDDGFGPAVARRLRDRPDLPRLALALDVGTSVRDVLFNVVLSPVRPRSIVVVDAVDMGRQPGDVWTLEARNLPEIKRDDFSMHQLPTSNLLRELNDLAGVNVICVVGQVEGFPSEVRPGLSAPVQHAVEQAVEVILQACGPAERTPVSSLTEPHPLPGERTKVRGHIDQTAQRGGTRPTDVGPVPATLRSRTSLRSTS